MEKKPLMAVLGSNPRRATDGNDLASRVAHGEGDECHCHTTPPWFEI